ncbi:helix-turn-helix transcriptional regulator [Actinomadura hibisca]|uniref:helix-turn-helix transcriptional regulator n=1 Tax=Actinomadura hibisca TaxID=68565 RepID=UPI00082DB63E|nr:helix-turn-helix transcriptional regulator [Actinomadura hibisca]
MTVQHSEQIGPLLRRLRQAAGWSQAQAADELCRRTGQATVTRNEWSRWENGRRTPTEVLPALAVLFNIPLRNLQAAVEATELAKRFPSLRVEDAATTDHLEGLRHRLTKTFTGGISATALQDWEETVQRYGRATRNRPAALLAADLTADLSELLTGLDCCRSVTSLRGLSRVTAHMAGLLCLTLIKLGDRRAFRGWARTARLAAVEAGDPAVRSWVLAQEAYGHYYAGDMAEAVHVSTAAREVTAVPTVGAVLAAALAARAHAAMSDQEATLEAVHDAEALLSKLANPLITASAFGYNEAQLRFHEGSALTHLATRRLIDTGPALTAQDRALELYPDDDFLDRTLVHLDRATCLVSVGDSTTGTAHALETLQALTDHQRRGILTTRGHEILGELTPSQRTSPTARDLHELLMTTTSEEEQHSWP